MAILNDNELRAVVGGGAGKSLYEMADGTKYITYTVDPGDCLSVIASHYGITLDDILRLNPEITNPNVIKVGQVIKIPYVG